MVAEPGFTPRHFDLNSKDGSRTREDCTELTRQGSQLQDTQQPIRRLEQLMNQTAQRAIEAEVKASAAFTAFGMVKAPEQKETKLRNRDAERSSGLKRKRETAWTRRASRSSWERSRRT